MKIRAKEHERDRSGVREGRREKGRREEGGGRNNRQIKGI